MNENKFSELKQLTIEEAVKMLNEKVVKLKKVYAKNPRPKHKAIVQKFQKIYEQHNLPVPPTCLMKKPKMELGNGVMTTTQTSEQLYYHCITQTIAFTDEQIAQLSEKDISILSGLYARNLSFNVDTGHVTLNNKKNIIKYHIKNLIKNI